ncbi:MAG: AraC family transcriptional regulator [Mobilitalea sp.]
MNTQYLLSPTISPLKYVSSGNLISKTDFLHHRRNFDLYVLIMIKEGTLYISQGGVNYILGPNEYLFLKAKEEHYGFKSSPSKLSYLWVHFLFPDTVSVLGENDLVKIFPKKASQASASEQYILPLSGQISPTQRATLLFNQLLDLSRQDVIYLKPMIDYALSLLLMEISQEFIEMHFNIKNKISPKVLMIMEWIKANFYRQITVVEIANEFNYNSDYLSFLFKQNTGLSLTAYINKTRIDISKSLLVNYNVSIKEAAYSSGFTDEKYYMKIFKRIEGLTPLQYKKAFTRKMIN